MGNKTILIVDDEENIRKLISYNLQKEGYETEVVSSGEEALSAAFNLIPDIIVLDLMLPGLDGIEVCKILSKDPRTSSIPILMVTARGEEGDIVTGLESGADDYLVKPFSPRILTARVGAILRRGSRDMASKSRIPKMVVHGITIDIQKHEVYVNGKAVPMSITEFAVLELLCRNPGWVLSRNQIISTVKGDDYPVTERSVDVQIVGIRKKLGESGKYLKTVRGIGYKMADINDGR